MGRLLIFSQKAAQAVQAKIKGPDGQRRTYVSTTPWYIPHLTFRGDAQYRNKRRKSKGPGGKGGQGAGKRKPREVLAKAEGQNAVAGSSKSKGKKKQT